MRINLIFYLRHIKLNERGLDGSRWLISSSLLETRARLNRRSGVKPLCESE